MLQAFLAIAVLVTATGITQENRVEIKSDCKNLLKAKEFLATANKEIAKWCGKETLASWKYDTNLTSENFENKIKVLTETSNYQKKLWKQAKAFSWKTLEDQDVKRQFSQFSNIEEAALPEELYTEYKNITSQMSTIHSTSKMCKYSNRTNCFTEEEVRAFMGIIRVPKILKKVWVDWKNVSAKKIRIFFPRYVELGNIAAKLNNYSDKSAAWLSKYEAKDFQQQLKSLWQEVKPLYLQIHAYVRRKLRKQYGDEVVPRDGPIQAHLLSDLYPGFWGGIAEFTLPFPEKSFPDITPAMVAQGYNVTKIFQLAESAFVSMNMSAMPELFWRNSILEKPSDREIGCQASAWDFHDGKDFRIKQCTRIHAKSLETAYHEMGHIQYFLQYKNQPFVYRAGANPGFHEAIGDVMDLSVSTPAHLQKIKLLENYTADEETSLNVLYLRALSKIVPLPFSYVIELWRSNVFRGKTTPDQYNSNWWKLIKKYQGIEPPVDRIEEDFDPASVFHIAADLEYMRYFVATILQYQFHRALCIEAGEYDPKDPKSKLLHECDITGSKKAGNRFKSMLKLGSSKPWQDAMEVLTGERKMSSSGILDYFKPLMNWLTVQNKETNEYIGWRRSGDRSDDRSEIRNLHTI